jgi:hypothetical protein
MLKEFPARTDRPIIVGAIVGKRNQIGWVGIVLELNGSGATVYWTGDPPKDKKFVNTSDLVVLDYGKEEERLRVRLPKPHQELAA